MNKPELKHKLTLNTETLHNLSPANLDAVVGGLGDIKATASCCLFNSCVTQPQPQLPK